MLFNEPKLLKCANVAVISGVISGFSALQRAEIAEINFITRKPSSTACRFSALQRAEIAEIPQPPPTRRPQLRFSALQRAEIAEILCARLMTGVVDGFSALQRAEIAEIETARYTRR